MMWLSKIVTGLGIGLVSFAHAVANPPDLPTPQQDPSIALVIHPNFGMPTHELMALDFLLLSPDFIPESPDGSAIFELKASLVLDNGASSLPVDAFVTWEIAHRNDAENATIDTSGVLRMPEFGVVRIVARFGDFISDPYRIEYSDEDPFAHFRFEDPEEDGAGEGGLRSPPPSNTELKQAATAGITRLRSYGFPQSWVGVGTAPALTIRANGNLSGDYLGQNIAAAYHNGTKWSPRGMLGGGGVYSLKSTIVINDKDARTLVNDGMFDSNSLLNDAGRLLLHELVHAAADAAGIKLPADLEEVIAHQIESVIANNLLRLRNVLLNANPPTANQQNRVRTHLINIRNSIKQSRDAAKTYKPSTRQANEDLLDLLRLSDQDGNGIPDIIDNMLQNLFPDGIPQWLQDILDEVFSPTGPNSGAPADIDGDGGLTPVTPDYP